MGNLDKIEKKIIELVKENLMIEVKKSEQMQVDSFNLTQLLFEIEEVFSVRFDPEDIKKIVLEITVERIASIISKKGGMI